MVEEVSSDSDKEVFQKAPILALDSLNKVQRAAQQHPGVLTNSAVIKMSEFLGTSVGASSSIERMRILPDPVVNTYLLTAFLQRYSEQMVGMRTVREMKTLAVCMDFLLTGHVLQALDVLTQRFKALELSVTQTWAHARHVELLPPQDVSVLSQAEVRLALQEERAERKTWAQRDRQ
eukprot:4014630-Amphidinium_carterae.1